MIQINHKSSNVKLFTGSFQKCIRSNPLCPVYCSLSRRPRRQDVLVQLITGANSKMRDVSRRSRIFTILTIDCKYIMISDKISETYILDKIRSVVGRLGL